MRKKALCVVLILVAFVQVPALAVSKASPNLQAALILKLLPLYSNLSAKPEFSIHVIAAEELAAILKKEIGKKVGKSVLKNVTSSNGPPSGPADVVYVGKDAGNTQFTKDNSVLSVTGNPDLIEKGVSLGIGIEGKKPKIFVNLASSKAEGVNWNPAILKLAKKVG